MFHHLNLKMEFLKKINLIFIKLIQFIIMKKLTVYLII